MNDMPVTSDDRASTSLPNSARISRWPVTMMWWASCSAIAYLFLGVQLALKFGTVNALIGMAIAAFVIGTLGGTLASHSLKTGESSSVLSQTLFGARGSSLPTLILCVTSIYYAAFEGAVVATAAVRVWPAMGYGLAVVLVVLFSAPLGMGRVQTVLNRLNAVLLPFYAAGLVMLATLAIKKHGYSKAWLHVGSPQTPNLLASWNCFVPYFGTLALAMITMDIARFGKATDRSYHRFFNFGVPFYLMTYLPAGAVGIFIVATTSSGPVPDTAVLDASLLLLGGICGLIWVIVTQTRINSANFYVATVNLQAFMEEAMDMRLPKTLCAGVVGIAVLLFMSSANLLGTILIALHYLGIFLVAWVGIAVSHVLNIRRAPFANEHSDLRDPNWPALLPWVAGVMTGVVLGMVAGLPGTFALPSTLVVSALLYRACDRRSRVNE
jgi:purine-cytosine permease-like protein